MIETATEEQLESITGPDREWAHIFIEPIRWIALCGEPLDGEPYPPGVMPDHICPDCLRVCREKGIPLPS